MENFLEIPLKEHRFAKEAQEELLLHFGEEKLDPRLLGVCRIPEENYSLEARKGYLLFMPERRRQRKIQLFRIWVFVRTPTLCIYLRDWSSSWIKRGCRRAFAISKPEKSSENGSDKNRRKFVFRVTQVVQGQEEILAEKHIQKKELEIHLKTENQKAGIFWTRERKSAGSRRDFFEILYDRILWRVCGLYHWAICVHLWKRKAVHGRTFHGFALLADKTPRPILEIQRKVRHFPELGGSTVVNLFKCALKEERLEKPDRIAISSMEREEFSSSSAAFATRRDAIYSGKDI